MSEVEVREPLSDKLSRRFNLVRALGWAGMMPTAFFFGWLASVTFVALCSLYANAASDWAAYRADQNRDLLERLTRIEEMLVSVCETADPLKTPPPLKPASPTYGLP